MLRAFNRFALVAVVAACCCRGGAQPLKLKDPLGNPGLVAFYNNRFDEAIADFQRDVQANSGDPDNYNHLAQAILYREMFRDGVLESQFVSGSNPFLRRSKMEISSDEKARFHAAIDKSLQLSQQLLTKDPKNVQALYALGVAHGLRANYLFLVEKQWLDALHDATLARKADEQIVSIDPAFLDARLLLSLSKYVVGCLPFYLRALGKADGYHGDKEGGIRELQEIAANGVVNRFDAEVLLAAIYFRERRAKAAMPLLSNLADTFKENYLFRFEQVQMYSDLGNKHAALKILAEVEQLRLSGAPGYAHIPAERIAYLKANLLFWYGDLDPALADLKQVTQRADDLDLSTAVMAWLRLGQVYDLRGDHQDAVSAYRETMKTAPNSEAAVEAKGYISSPYHRKRQTV